MGMMWTLRTVMLMLFIASVSSKPFHSWNQNKHQINRDFQTSDSVESDESSDTSDEDRSWSSESSEPLESHESSWSSSSSSESRESSSSSSEENILTTPSPDIIISQATEETVTTSGDITCFTVLHTTAEPRGDN
ncbi:secretory calcium-binding phosphoprotein 8 [Pygocentrus nattereri]|uniref:secretory calcium-binding phosphoprotein 8 n=1 Tax=Pygocentrus nattereri TaxID=42514 RepID=UPI000814A5A8|nr:secretory calcium-binding phosphoprotein 8 [Pygocentrus nattereri]